MEMSPKKSAILSILIYTLDIGVPEAWGPKGPNPLWLLDFAQERIQILASIGLKRGFLVKQ